MISKNMRMAKTVLFFLSILMIGILLTTTTVSLASTDSDDIVTFLAQELKLDDQQKQDLGVAMEKFAKQLDQLIEAQEAEDADPDALIKGVKQAQDGHNKELEKIFTPEQFKQYNALKEKAIKGMFSDLAEIKLMDIQPKTSISDEQVSQLVPILGSSMYNIVKIAWDNAGKKLRAPQKIKLAKKMKGIQADTRAGIEKVLTPEQLKAWDKYKEEQKK
ncbi:MAG: hypothetical protein JRE14_09770 [Deltaproteobacteria bacterium]|nr:hypothetical protein [Deltaproteobacteria bacterium]